MSRVRLLRAAVLALIGVIPALQTRAAEVRKTVSPGGIEAWLIEDHKVPVVSIRFSFDGGTALDPVGKEGLVELATTLMDEGAGDLKAQAFQKKLADESITFGLSADRDRLYGTLKTLTEKRDLAVDLAALALARPRFDADAVERMRDAALTTIQTQLSNPGFIASQTLSQTIYQGHPYSRPQRGTLASVKSITAADLKAFVKGRLTRDTLLVTAAGDIDPAALGLVLDRMFGGLPAKAAPSQVPDIELKNPGKLVTVKLPIPQSLVVAATQGVKRGDPDWYAASLMNYVLGGGGFNARLMEEIRDKRGLTYGISSGLVPYRHAALLTVQGGTKNQTAGEMLGLLKEEFQKMADKGVTERELQEAKDYQTGSLPLSMTSTDRIAGLLLQIRQDNLGIDFLDRRNDLIRAVTLEQVNAVAKRLLDPSRLTVVAVGQPEGLAQPK